jgi:hypothetical protein
VQTVNQAVPVVLLVSSLNPSTFEQNVTFKAKVHNSSNTPTGSVTFYDGASSLGNFALSGDSAQVSTASLGAGGHTIKVVYGGDSNFKSDSTTIVQTVNQSGPTVILASSLNPSIFQQNVTFKAKVHNGSNTPTGSVTFYDGASSLGTFALVGDSAEVSTASLTGGSHTIKAVYEGDGNFKSDSTTIVQTVNKAATASVLTTSPNPSVYFQSVLFRDSVSGLPAGPPDGGKVYFSVDNTVLDSSLVDVNGIASVSIATLTGGTHAVSAHYGGTGNFDTSSSNTVTQVVSKKATTSTLTTSPNPSV